MNKNLRLTKLKEWKKQYDICNTAWNGINMFMNMDMESPLAVSIWKTFDKYTETLSQLIGDEPGWLDWYCWDNDMGKKRMKAGNKGKMKSIKTIEDLNNIINNEETMPMKK